MNGTRRRASSGARLLVVALVGSSLVGGGARADAGDGERPHARAVIADDFREVEILGARTAAWCGTPAQADRAPNAVAGYPVHWVYAIPADGEDRVDATAGLMQADAEAIDAWWRREDSLRTVRNDLAQFPCGLQLDLSALRLPQPAAQLPADARFAAIFGALRAAGFNSDLTKYVVYYDGPASDTRTCGEGGGLRSGIGLAVVYLRACTSVSTAAVAAHELLHTLGAVSSVAPNACPPASGGHTCDNELDLMYPSIDSSPLETRLLDPGRDDYYGHGRSWPDAREAPWLVQLDRQAPFTLSVTGPGRVVASVPGLDCTRPCTTTWNRDTQLVLRATPSPGAKLVRWGGACGGSATCSVVIGQAGATSALFAPASYRLDIRVVGRGGVTSGRPGIACQPRCAGSFPSYVPLRLTAKPAPGWKLTAWAGACRGSRAICTVPMTRASSVRATFARAGR
ncbi:MAG: hypothetical protein R6W48_05455 [Gaiellaceae bacterium]